MMHRELHPPLPQPMGLRPMHKKVQKKTEQAGGPPTALARSDWPGGASLAQEARAPYETAFGQDFSAVRIHDDARAHDAARALDARAFTQGQDIVFGQGQFRPETAEGRGLLAHELAHAVQQSPARQTAPLASLAAGADRALEAEADRAASAFAEARPVPGLTRLAAPAIQRNKTATPAPQNAPVATTAGPAIKLPAEMEILGSFDAKLEGGVFVATGTLTPGGKVPGISAASGQVTYNSDTGWSGSIKATTSSFKGFSVDAELGFQSKGQALSYWGKGGLAWRRAREPAYADKALGDAEAAGRGLLDWQIFPFGLTAPVECATVLSQPAYQALIAPSSGTIGVKTTVPGPGSDPCSLLPQGGFTRLENLLYRAEVHGGTTMPNTPTADGPRFRLQGLKLKLSRSNASLLAAVGAVQGVEITTKAPALDPRRWFTPGSYAEIVSLHDDVDPRAALANERLFRVAQASDDKILLDATPAQVAATGVQADGTWFLRLWDAWPDLNGSGFVTVGAPAGGGLAPEISLGDGLTLVPGGGTTGFFTARRLLDLRRARRWHDRLAGRGPAGNAARTGHPVCAACGGDGFPDRSDI